MMYSTDYQGLFFLIIAILAVFASAMIWSGAIDNHSSFDMITDTTWQSLDSSNNGSTYIVFFNGGSGYLKTNETNEFVWSREVMTLFNLNEYSVSVHFIETNIIRVFNVNKNMMYSENEVFRKVVNS